MQSSRGHPNLRCSSLAKVDFPVPGVPVMIINILNGYFSFLVVKERIFINMVTIWSLMLETILERCKKLVGIASLAVTMHACDRPPVNLSIYNNTSVIPTSGMIDAGYDANEVPQGTNALMLALMLPGTPLWPMHCL